MLSTETVRYAYVLIFKLKDFIFPVTLIRFSPRLTFFRFQADLRSYLSEPELPGMGHHDTGSDLDYQYFPGRGI